MDSPHQSGSPSAAPPPELEAKREKEMVHKTKVIQFLGRTAPIILQNDNGPCPLLAICNVLSLKNSLNLSPDIPEVSQEKLLSLVAERLIDSNTNTDNKDTGYVENQLQNIADAIDLLPRLTTGIDVNLKFRRIDDFEFTPECAIYDLLDIPLYHGWIVDPQDHETADAIGAKSYNTLMGELVSLEAKSITSDEKKNSEDDTVDFVAATTAALGIPSPSLSRGQSFNDSPPQARKGDIEEEEELLKALRLSEMENSIPMADSVVSDGHMHESESINKCELLAPPEMVETNFAVESAKTVALISNDSNALGELHVDPGSEVVSHEALSSETDEKQLCSRPSDEESRNVVDNVIGSGTVILNGKVQPVSLGQDRLPASSDSQHKLMSDNHAQDQVTSTSNPEAEKNSCDVSDGKDSSSLLNSADSDSSSSQMHQNDKPEAKSSIVDDSEPIYEGEDRILDSRTVAYANREPMYEGEVVLAEQVDTGFVDNGDFGRKDTISVKEGEIIKNFMKNSASQLTVYGLFCLQDKVKERELCVFFRNNHFNTMFKYEGELYILATDQGYLNQPDLVWEKLNEVNGDTVYMTGNFKQFKMDEHSSSTWDEQNARATTADYLASIDSSEPNTSFNSDLQLAIALQQQEFDQQQQEQQREQQQQRNAQQQAVSGSSRLIVGPPQPQAPRNSGKYTSSSKQESKSKEKCIIM
ncbi:ubiquitin carboxyl-terminal hydrolase MINDY-1-like [Salvia splendens]|uniref:ubiquitin carboxyl-terminal hydrolase MINDY-1-like n=1 Tax=Salvia splendens TaxID=180675 RepID=UPI001C256737|nr:ubiquitin carboxyl-terminal hydrolase MINDY-1-like [Salvia splendens]